MKPINLYLLLFCLFCSSQTKAQFFYYRKAPDPAVTQANMEKSKVDLDKAYVSYNDGDLTKTKYFLDQSEKKGFVSDRFYYLLGQWSFDMGKSKDARRYWMRGYAKHGCWECKELADKLAP